MLFTWFTGVCLECRLQLYSILKSALDPITAGVREISAIFFRPVFSCKGNERGYIKMEQKLALGKKKQNLRTIRLNNWL